MKVGLDLIKSTQGSPTMKAWTTSKSPKAAASICVHMRFCGKKQNEGFNCTNA
jgi:hypothetical protein